MATRDSSAVGLVIKDGDDYYCLADDDAYFLVYNKEVSCQAGSFVDGKWICDEEKHTDYWQVNWRTGDYAVSYSAGELIKITLKNKKEN